MTFAAERNSIAEEMERLDSHMQQIENLLKSRGEAIGKTLDFLTQEMARETHTLWAKVADLDLLNRTLHMKIVLDKMREQVQNIE